MPVASPTPLADPVVPRTPTLSLEPPRPASPPLAPGARPGQQTRFLAYLHYFRALALLLVVAIHCLPFLDPAGAQSPLFRVLAPLVDRSTLLFVFIGGFLFQHLASTFQTRSFYRSKFRNVLLPYLLLSLPIIVVRLLTDTPAALAEARVEGFAQWPVAYQVLYYYATGLHLVPFWFMPMIALYYLLAPALVWLDRQGGIYYALPLFLALSLVVTRAATGDQVLSSAVHLFSVYLLGMFVSRHRRAVLALVRRFRAGLLVALLLVTSLSIGAYQTPWREQTLFGQKLLLTFVLLEALHRFQHRPSPVLTKLATMSFGIYFLHFYVLYALQAGYQQVTGRQHVEFTLLNWAGLLLLAVGGSMLVLTVAKKLLKDRSRLLVGY